MVGHEKRHENQLTKKSVFWHEKKKVEKIQVWWHYAYLGIFVDDAQTDRQTVFFCKLIIYKPVGPSVEP